MFNTLSILEVKLKAGSLIKQLRKQQKLSQQQLGDNLKLSRLTIQNLETGKNITMDTFLLVLQYFNALENFNTYLNETSENINSISLY